MDAARQSWEAMAADKRARTLAKIPSRWRLGPADLERASKQRDLTGPLIEGFLDANEIAIINIDSDKVQAVYHGSVCFPVEVANSHAASNDIVCFSSFRRRRDAGHHIVNSAVMLALFGCAICFEYPAGLAGVRFRRARQ